MAVVAAAKAPVLALPATSGAATQLGAVLVPRVQHSRKHPHPLELDALDVALQVQRHHLFCVVALCGVLPGALLALAREPLEHAGEHGKLREQHAGEQRVRVAAARAAVDAHQQGVDPVAQVPLRGVWAPGLGVLEDQRDPLRDRERECLRHRGRARHEWVRRIREAIVTGVRARSGPERGRHHEHMHKVGHVWQRERREVVPNRAVQVVAIHQLEVVRAGRWREQ